MKASSLAFWSSSASAYVSLSVFRMASKLFSFLLLFRGHLLVLTVLSHKVSQNGCFFLTYYIFGIFACHAGKIFIIITRFLTVRQKENEKSFHIFKKLLTFSFLACIVNIIDIIFLLFTVRQLQP